jgi:hypothetical protein
LSRPHIRLFLNNTLLHDVDLVGEQRALERGLPLAARPRLGRIGFQELSRGGGRVQIRNAEIKEIES